MLKIKIIILILGCLVLLNIDAKAQQVSIKDTTITTDFVSLPVFGNTGEDWNGKTIEYRFSVSWASFQLLDVVADNNSAVLDKNIQFSYDWQERIISVTINSMQSNFNGNLFNIVIKVLTRVDFYSPNEVFQITPTEIIVKDGNTSNTIPLESPTAYVRIDYLPSNLTYIEDVSFNYPNPFLTETTILFSVNEKADVSFEIYSSLGRLVQRIPNKEDDSQNDGFRYELYDENRTTVQIEENKLEKGIYRLFLTAKKTEASVSVYYVVVRIGNNSHLVKMCIN
ncbi:MAG: T9SS type A sorting domain-containing protein [Bacteroidetes bacterium]|nr:T9SS type A sorting domain-containing protein [Bacteroidota bacterium]